MKSESWRALRTWRMTCATHNSLEWAGLFQVGSFLNTKDKTIQRSVGEPAEGSFTNYMGSS